MRTSCYIPLGRQGSPQFSILLPEAEQPESFFTLNLPIGNSSTLVKTRALLRCSRDYRVHKECLLSELLAAGQAPPRETSAKSLGYRGTWEPQVVLESLVSQALFFFSFNLTVVLAFGPYTEYVTFSLLHIPLPKLPRAHWTFISVFSRVTFGIS